MSDATDDTRPVPPGRTMHREGVDRRVKTGYATTPGDRNRQGPPVRRARHAHGDRGRGNHPLRGRGPRKRAGRRVHLGNRSGAVAVGLAGPGAREPIPDTGVCPAGHRSLVPHRSLFRRSARGFAARSFRGLPSVGLAARVLSVAPLTARGSLSLPARLSEALPLVAPRASRSPIRRPPSGRPPGSRLAPLTARSFRGAPFGRASQPTLK